MMPHTLCRCLIFFNNAIIGIFIRFLTPIAMVLVHIIVSADNVTNEKVRNTTIGQVVMRSLSFQKHDWFFRC
jgi:hypothetical protein